MSKPPQPGETSFRVLYTYHVGEASRYERMAEGLMAATRLRVERTNPVASVEWIDTQVSNDHRVKSAIANQQFHTREATKYGFGMVTEAFGMKFSTLEERCAPHLKQ